MVVPGHPPGALPGKPSGTAGPRGCARRPRPDRSLRRRRGTRRPGLRRTCRRGRRCRRCRPGAARCPRRRRPAGWSAERCRPAVPSCRGRWSMPAAAGEFVVRDPVAGEDDRVALDDPRVAGVEILDLDRLADAPADDPHDAGAGGDRDPEQRLAGNVERGVGLRRRVLRRHQHGPASGVRAASCTADQLTSSAPTTTARVADRAVVQVHDVLQLPGGVDPGRPVAGNQPGRAGTLAGTGGQDDAPGPRRGADPAGVVTSSASSGCTSRSPSPRSGSSAPAAVGLAAPGVRRRRGRR